jgi:hypothetical protein
MLFPAPLTGSKTHSSVSELHLRFDIAMCRVELQIEEYALDALLELGITDEVVLADADMRILCWQVDLTYLDQEALQWRSMRDSGCIPFDPDKWGLACKSALASSFPGVSSYKKAHETDAWFSQCMSCIADDAKPEAGEIFQRCRSAAYGMDPFDADIFYETCDQASREAAHGCGLSDVLWLTRCTTSIGSLLPSVPLASLAKAHVVARNAGWLDPAELKDLTAWTEDEGLCSHGLELECCPAGCGELDLEHGFD